MLSPLQDSYAQFTIHPFLSCANRPPFSSQFVACRLLIQGGIGQTTPQGQVCGSHRVLV